MTVTDLIQEIRETHRQRQDLLRAELRLNNQIEAIYRRFTGMKIEERTRYERALAAEGGEDGHGGLDNQNAIAYFAALAAAEMAAEPLRMAIHGDGGTWQGIHYWTRQQEKAMEKLAKQLPIWPWAEACRGLSALSLAQIVGEIGDFNNYPNPAKVWKRAGVGIVDGQRQRKTTDKDLAIKMGYNATRRSIMWVIGDNLIRAKHPVYYEYYATEKERLAEKWPETTKMHIHRAAHRHMEKRFLRDLWQEWRALGSVVPNPPLPTTAPPIAAD